MIKNLKNYSHSLLINDDFGSEVSGSSTVSLQIENEDVEEETSLPSLKSLPRDNLSKKVTKR
mgnify:CR=1 FL=1